jgi:hypothetical protein
MSLWLFPLDDCSGIPINFHPGAFGFKRRKNFHTGVDLYTKPLEPVYACEDGVIIKIDQFTGKALGMDWWLDTWAIMVEGESGVINYGEVTKPDHLFVGSKVSTGDYLSYVLPVVKEGRERPDIEGHSRYMLHIELYKHGTSDFAQTEFAHWHPNRDPNLLDPTSFIIDSFGRPTKFFSWYNFEGLEAG